jgi:hypothetical protein
MRRLLLALLALGSGAGCATSLSTFQPAHVPPEGHFGVEAGLDLSLPTGTVSRTVDAARALSDAAERRALSEEEQVTIFEAGVNLALNPPFLVEHLAVSYTPIERWELALRYASKAWRFGVRHQVLHQATTGFDLSLGLGVQRFRFQFPVTEIVQVLHLDDFVRWNVDAPLLFGRQGDFYRLWAGPRLVLSRFSSQMVLRLPPAAGMSLQEKVAGAEGTGLYFGAQAGAALGYKKLFLAFELTLVRLFGQAQLSALDFRREVDMGTWVIYPGLALMGEF